MKKYYDGLKLAFSFFTILPVKSEYNQKNLYYSVYSYPIIGLFLGLMIYISSVIFQIIFSELIILSAILLLIVEYSLSNFFHIDGFCDTIDALYFTKKGKDKYEILKDPHIGTYAVCWLIILILLKTSAYYICISENQLSNFFVFAIFSYYAVPFQVYFLKPFNKTGLGFSFKNVVVIKHLFFNFFLSFFLAGLIAGFNTLFWASIFLFIVLIIINKLINYKFEGYNGDTLGFSIEVLKILLFWFLIIFT